jgi:DNA (cytosine-5)-methyltransferase 1
MLKVRTLFSGIGSPERALKDLKIPYELVDFCEVDKYAVKSYCAVHEVNPDKNLGDITKVWGRNLPYADLLVWGFPCTDISVAGKQAGIVEGETRSGLYYEGLRILKETKPKYSIIENVKNLTGKKFKAEFEQMLKDIEELGYNNYWQVLNAKDYGIPQNRERVFIVSIRKDIDTNTFMFPKGFDNGLRLKDFLENEVDEKYYISQDKVNKIINSNFIQERTMIQNGEGNCQTLLARDYKDPKCVAIPCITPDRVEKRQNGRRFKEDGDPMFTLTSQDRHGILQISESPMPELIGGVGEINFGKQYRQGNRIYSSEKTAMCLMAQPVGNTGGYSYLYKVAVKEATKKGYSEAVVGDSINIQFPNSETRRGRVGHEVAQTLETSCNQATLTHDYRIRKLTPKECWRLMGFKDEDFQKAVDSGVSNSQLYKQAGNSIVSNVLFYIFKNLLQAEIAAIYEENKELS